MAVFLDHINPVMLHWAIVRAGYDVDSFLEGPEDASATLKKDLEMYRSWIDGTGKPTAKQLEAFSHRLHVPIGYLFFDSPPEERIPFPYFRGRKKTYQQFNLNLWDTILTMEGRKDWLCEYLQENEYEALSYVGSYNQNSNIKDVVTSMHQELKLEPGWQLNIKHINKEKTLRYFIGAIERAGMFVSQHSYVGCNTRRTIEVQDCRGFVIVDEYAPIIFINNRDAKSANMFTLAHELSHIWTGSSAGFDQETIRVVKSRDREERFCDLVAVEFLMPENLVKPMLHSIDDIEKCASLFRVSEIAMARRALELNVIDESQFYRIYEKLEKTPIKKKLRGGGNFYAVARQQIGDTLSLYIANALKSRQISYRDAYDLTNLKGRTLDSYFKHYNFNAVLT